MAQDLHKAGLPKAGLADRRWRDLRLRVISAMIMAPVCLVCIWLGEVPWAALLALAVGWLAVEWVRLCGAAAATLPGVAVPVIVCLSCALAVIDRVGWGLALLLAGGLVFAGLAGAWARAGARHLAWGVLYVGLPGIALIWLRGDDGVGRANVLFLVLVVWASDIGAYVAGRLVGGRKLAPAISPGKTWSGAAGGLLSAALVGMAAAAVQAPPATPLPAAVLALALGVVSQAGDLLESLLKRRFGVKDSGRLIPGHGGLLDRMDGLMAAAPAAALVALALGRGVYLWR